MRTSAALSRSKRASPSTRARIASQSTLCSGDGASGTGSWCEMPDSGSAKLAARLKIASPDWYATTRRVV
jgi:hypothetical protein